MYEHRENSKRLQREMNPKTLQLLENKGCDLGNTRLIMNVFYAKSKEEIEKLKELLKTYDFRFSNDMLSPSAKNPFEWCLKAEIILSPSLENINNMTDMCVDLADEVDAEYDGWYTEA